MQVQTKGQSAKALRITDPGFSSCLVCLLPGELVQQRFLSISILLSARFDDILLQGYDFTHKGSVFLTNYRLVFCYSDKVWYEI